MAGKERNSIKDEATYKALREDGASKEKAARIANARAAGGEPSIKGGQASPYEDWSKDALYDRAKEIGIDGRSGMTKAELIHALRHH
ncbi:Rho termination factor [Hyphomonadaceae bacterium ML37]|nr:Rho termination factor [Hyphomonadaceae bacterium ML37]